MSDPLGSAWLKLDRADKHLNELLRKVDAFAERQPYTSERHLDRNRGLHIYRVNLPRKPPRTWGPVIGDAVHNMRSSLDHLAWALACLTTSNPSRKTAFPIFERWNDRSPRNFASMVRQMPDAAKQAVDELQPYKHGELAGKHPLAVLSYLSNRDKHQLLVPLGTILVID